LTADEIANAEAWVRAGTVYAAVLGDSTIAALNSAVVLPVAMRVSSIVGGLVVGAGELSHSGDRISHQLADWTALTNKGALEVVIVQIGQNDVKGRVGEGTATTATVISDYQNLINTIATDAPQADIYVSTLTPSRGWLDLATDPAAAYSAWQGLNEAIAGNGSTPITGVAGRITSHTDDMGDATDYLLPEFEYSASDFVHPNNAGRFINAMAWRTKLEADGWL
jgi:lysophospholipase L1-like esterase